MPCTPTSPRGWAGRWPTTLRVDADGLPAGTVVGYTSVTTAVVDEPGQLPPG